MKAELTRFEAKIDEIQAFGQLLESVVQAQSAAPPEPASEEHRALKQLRASFEAISRTALRERSYSATISATYAAFETFVEDLIEGYVEAVVSITDRFSELPEPMRASHSELTMFALSRLQWQRLASRTSEAQLVERWNRCLSDGAPLAVNAMVYSLHERNLKTAELSKLLGKTGLADTVPRILRYEYYRDAVEGYVDGAAVSHTPFDDFVERRNEISHGDAPSDLLSHEYVLALVQVVRAFARAIHDVCRVELLRHFVQREGIPIGRPRKSLKDHRVVVVDLSDARIAVDDIIVVGSADRTLVPVMVTGLRLQDDVRTEIDCRGVVTPTRCGIALDGEARLNHDLFIVASETVATDAWNEVIGF